MSYFRSTKIPVSPVISPWATESIGVTLAARAFAAPGSAANPVANRAVYVPVRIPDTITVVKMFCHNGATVSGNVDLGIYTSGGTRLVSTGSTAQAGASIVQEFDITDTTLTPGLYYMALAADNATATFIRLAFTVEVGNALGILGQETAFPLPASATFGADLGQGLAEFGISTRTVLA